MNAPTSFASWNLKRTVLPVTIAFVIGVACAWGMGQLVGSQLNADSKSCEGMAILVCALVVLACMALALLLGGGVVAYVLLRRAKVRRAGSITLLASVTIVLGVRLIFTFLPVLPVGLAYALSAVLVFGNFILYDWYVNALRMRWMGKFVVLLLGLAVLLLSPSFVSRLF